MGNITVINATPYREWAVPEVGKEYHIFDDGKIRPSRHYIAKILEVIPFEKADPEIICVWRSEVENAYWLYATKTDYFVKAESDFDEDHLYFVRTKDSSWFSINVTSWWQSARLDVDGSIYQKMVEYYGEDGKVCQN
jgi:hypothetical protein